MKNFITGWRFAALKNGFQDTMADRLEFLMEVVGYMAVPACVQLVLWYALFKVGGKDTIAGQTFQDFVAYTFTSILFTQVRGGNHDFELQDMIRSGSLSQYLLRPVNVIEFVYIRGISGKVLITLMCFLIGFTVMPFFGFNPFRLIGSMAMAFLGNMIHYQMGAALAALAFKWEEAYSVLMVKNMVVDLLSGELIPLNLFPEHLSWIWKSTPFYLYVYGPTSFALGRWTVLEFFQNFSIGVLWLMAFTALTQFLWKRGIRNYLALGG